VFNATASVFGSDPSGPPLLQIPIRAIVSPGKLSIASLTTAAIFAGQTQTLQFRLTSSLRRDIAGVFTCDSKPPGPFTSDTDPQFPAVPAGATLDVPLAVTCAPGTPIGNYNVVFRLRAIDNSAEFGSAQVTIPVVASRSVSITSNLVSNPVLKPGSSTPCDFKISVTGGPTTFTLAPGSVPDGITVANGSQTVPVDGNVFLGLNLTIAPDVPTSRNLPTLTFNWSVPADTLHPAAAGSLTFNIATDKRPIFFGLASFHVVNCRSKGDHNDRDTLFVVVTAGKTPYPEQHILVGANLHANDTVANIYVGPFEIDDSDYVSVTYTVINSTTGDDTAAVPLKLVGAIAEVVLGLEELHFLGLAASKIEAAILGSAGGIFGGLGELIGLHNSNPNCSGVVLVRTFTYGPGQLRDMPQHSPSTQETQQSPQDCGNAPQSIVVYSAKQVA
jgi:hypothetical protein